MANRHVTHVFRNTDGDILVIGNPEQDWHQRHREWAISDIIADRHTYFVEGNERDELPIDVINGPSGLYLRTRGDSTEGNNLDILPEFDYEPWEIAIEDAEILAVHAALINHGPQGQVLLLGGNEHDSSQENEFLKTRVYDIDSNRIIEVDSPGADAFCCDHAMLGDGRLLIGGGTESWIHLDVNHVDASGFALPHWSGARECSVYNSDGTWSSVGSLLPEPGQVSRGGGRWYPTLVTLGDGDVLAVGGHPRVSEDENNDGRHGSWLPERYNPDSQTWSYQPGHWIYVQWSNVGPTSPEGLADDDVLVELPEGQQRGTVNSYLYYPRMYTVPDGRVFMVSPNEGQCNWYNPETGLVDGPDIEPPAHNVGFAETNHTAVLLPLLPGDDYTPHILFMGMQGSRRITLADMIDDDPPAWQPTVDRDWAGTPPLRRHGCATLLPTGDVLFTGGIDNTDGSGLPDTDATLAAELYAPGIDWDENEITYADEEWTTTPSANVPRNYHSVALLLPNGRVLNAGSNINGSQGGDEAKEYRIEIYMPPYDKDDNRQTIETAPSAISYGQGFNFSCSNSDRIQRVALIRCGSVTHSWDGDQRYVGLEFSRIDDHIINATAPPNGNIAPPGPYMLWIVDDRQRPCKLAPFVLLN